MAKKKSKKKPSWTDVIDTRRSPQPVYVNLYEIFQREVEAGARQGIRRYYKHREGLPEDIEIERMAEEVLNAVMLNLLEVVEFSEDE